MAPKSLDRLLCVLNEHGDPALLKRAVSEVVPTSYDGSQNEALLGSLRPYFLESQVRGVQPAPMGNSHPGMSPHGIYPASGDDQWIALSVADDVQWKSLAALAAGTRPSRCSAIARPARWNSSVEAPAAEGIACAALRSDTNRWKLPTMASTATGAPRQAPIVSRPIGAPNRKLLA